MIRDWLRRGVLATALAGVVSGCGGDGASAPATSSVVGVTSTAPASTRPAVTTVPPTTARDDVKEITAAFTLFFDGREKSIDKKVAALETGEKYRSMLEDAAKNSQFQQLSAQIRSIRILSEPECRTASLTPKCALVVHDLLVGAFPALVAHESPAVYIDGAWKVGAKAWCDVVAIGGDKCPV